jgi:hypothetical protein
MMLRWLRRRQEAHGLAQADAAALIRDMVPRPPVSFPRKGKKMPDDASHAPKSSFRSSANIVPRATLDQNDRALRAINRRYCPRRVRVANCAIYAASSTPAAPASCPLRGFHSYLKSLL